MNNKKIIRATIVVLALSLSAVAGAAEPTKVYYECGALKFDVEYSADGTSLKMLPAHVLEREAVESGILYAGKGTEIRGKSRTEDIEIRPSPRRSFIKCQSIQVKG